MWTCCKHPVDLCRSVKKCPDEFLCGSVLAPQVTVLLTPQAATGPHRLLPCSSLRNTGEQPLLCPSTRLKNLWQQQQYTPQESMAAAAVQASREAAATIDSYSTPTLIGLELNAMWQQLILLHLKSCLSVKSAWTHRSSSRPFFSEILSCHTLSSDQRARQVYWCHPGL